MAQQNNHEIHHHTQNEGNISKQLNDDIVKSLN